MYLCLLSYKEIERLDRLHLHSTGDPQGHLFFPLYLQFLSCILSENEDKIEQK